MDLKDIKAIIDLMKKNSLSEFELEKQEFKIKLKRSPGAAGGEDFPVTYTLPSQIASVATAPPALGAPALPPSAATSGIEIKSPMIGTFYRAPSPESGNYVEVGTEVNPETVVCLIEAMKVMNEIKAEVRGIITEILVDNAKPVEFGQPMFKIKPV
ncbi:MAG: acetyl-CoA carboxylase biotin carboxyl carrier protein [Verrucomicrobia bacterium]|nr:acetyl-CoA carboxylase biotin carboxyl carrier protein [Verrucomicrobiota bacterium]